MGMRDKIIIGVTAVLVISTVVIVSVAGKSRGNDRYRNMNDDPVAEDEVQDDEMGENEDEVNDVEMIDEEDATESIEEDKGNEEANDA